MTHKEKAEEIVFKFRNTLSSDNRSWKVEYKQCALICVEEILKETKRTNADISRSRYSYWVGVKQEIEKI